MPSCALMLSTLAMFSGCALPDDAPKAAAAQATEPAPAAEQAPRTGAAAMQVQPGIPLDLSYVDKDSPAFARFKRWVDSAASGNPGYAFAASDAAIAFRLTQQQKYCDLAVRMVEEQVTEAEAAIAAGGKPPISGDSYLEVGPRIADLSMTLDTCKAQIGADQQKRWGAYAEQAVWNVWHHVRANWGGRPHPWSGWSVDNPGNNYYYSFVEATMFWALASGSSEWMTFLRDEKLPPLQAYFAKLPGGGSLEGTGYGAAHMRLFSLYRLWRDATGQDLANANTHADDSIAYWVNATVPTLDRFAPLGDQSRSSIPEIYDYHRRIVLEARQLGKNPERQALASWWLGNISMREMSNGFNTVHDLLPAGKAGAPPTALVYEAKGVGHLFARTGWDKDAMWLSFVAGPYNESHAHQEQGGFTLFARDWLAVSENIWSHSGIQQGTETNNVVRFERSDPDAQQCMAPRGDRVVHQCEQPTPATMTVTQPGDGSVTVDADLTPVYRGNPALKSWKRKLEFGGRKLKVTDDFALGSGTQAFFQVNTPVEPRIQGNQAIAGRLKITVLAPANATLTAHDWSKVDAAEFRNGWRLDVAGGTTGYVVELSEAD